MGFLTDWHVRNHYFLFGESLIFKDPVFWAGDLEALHLYPHTDDNHHKKRDPNVDCKTL